MSADGRRCSSAAAVAQDAINSRIDDSRVLGKAKVIIGDQTGQAFAVHRDDGPAAGRNR